MYQSATAKNHDASNKDAPETTPLEKKPSGMGDQQNDNISDNYDDDDMDKQNQQNEPPKFLADQNRVKISDKDEKEKVKENQGGF